MRITPILHFRFLTIFTFLSMASISEKVFADHDFMYPEAEGEKILQHIEKGSVVVDYCPGQCENKSVRIVEVESLRTANMGQGMISIGAKVKFIGVSQAHLLSTQDFVCVFDLTDTDRDELVDRYNYEDISIDLNYTLVYSGKRKAFVHLGHFIDDERTGLMLDVDPSVLQSINVCRESIAQ